MKRRDFIALMGGAAVTAPLGARAQQAKIPRIGMISAGVNMLAITGNYAAFQSQMRELGFIEGQNYSVEYRDITDPRGPFAVAADLMRTEPDLIVVTGPEAGLQAVVGASRAIPIVILAVQYDPIIRGYVQSLARPGGNITGVFLRQLELAEKQIEILNQTFPQRTRLAAMFDRFTADQFDAAERMAKSLKIQLMPVKLEKAPYDFAPAFQAAADGGAQMAVVFSSPFFTTSAPRIVELAIEHRFPTMFTFRHYPEAGGLMSYGVDFPAMFRKTADYVARILRVRSPLIYQLSWLPNSRR
jgi:putative ABC transport system substrate-binding protein